MKKEKYLLYLFITLLLSIIFYDTKVNFAPNLDVSIGLIIYSFTFLINILMFNKIKLKNSRWVIFNSAIFILGFYFITSLLCSINPEADLIKMVFCPNNVIIGNFALYYPNLGHLITFLIVYMFSHYMFLIVYDVVEDNSNYLVGFIMAILITFLLDQMLYTGITTFYDLINNNVTIKMYINTLTSNFIIILMESIVMLFIYPLFMIKKAK